ncbi:LysR family transcriptional regulator [Cupriavidus pauculus]|uniref:LysR family transcriptional regulator n=1 Tax=Cupriavidus pauculus TaxID=82633 RepID=UPI001EE2A162|nr:LysR family transcriptional regulator [Cupriavidus pauculus]GJG97281.1 hypothetical protein CBA19C6_22350 [Cupriavidus pauculus]
MWDINQSLPESAPQSETPRHTRLALAIHIRPPDYLYGALPLRHINTSRLRRFVMLMHHESAIVAGRHTGIRAACIHYAVRRLEDRLSTQLFVREASSMHRTAAAQRLYPCAIRLLSMWDNLVAESVRA